jgi:hypothetical protein
LAQEIQTGENTMGLLSGALDAVKGVVGIATAPARTALKIAGTGLTTGGNVLGNLATGNVGGAASALSQGAQQQVGNVTGYFGENVDNVRQIAGGHVEFLQGGAGLIGTPIRGAARLAGNGLTATGGAVTNLAQGNASGALQSYQTGAQNAFGIAGQTLGQQADNIF